jgi:hypothetical protein
VRTKSKDVELGDSLYAFMKKLEMVPSGGKLGTVRRLKEQVKRLFSSTFTIVFDETADMTQPGRFATAGFKIADSYEFLWDPVRPDQGLLFQPRVTVSDKFFCEIVGHPVPLDMRILKELRSSPFAVDLYVWLSYRMSYLQKETMIPWNSLQGQFGSDYKQLKSFKFNLIKTLDGILQHYPVKISAKQTGLLLVPSNTSVPKKGQF